MVVNMMVTTIISVTKKNVRKVLININIQNLKLPKPGSDASLRLKDYGAIRVFMS